MLKCSTLFTGALALTLGSAAFAHPRDLEFDNRGQCEAALAQWNNMDRMRDWDEGTRDPDDSNRYYHATWRCEEVREGVWKMVKQ